ncbi:MAG: SpoIVB peptidase [Firmicutes bacterium]|nr:SpoIVB peptidase [Bacillota bacterium]
MQKIKQKKVLLLWLSVILLGIVFISTWHLRMILVENIRINEGDLHYVNLKSPFSLHVRADKEGIINLNGSSTCTERRKITTDNLTLEALSLGEVNLEFSLFGLIPLREVTVSVLPEIKVVPGGHSIGIKLHSEGVIVSGFYSVDHKNFSPAQEAGVKIGDIIIAIEDEKINDINEVAEIINQLGEREITFTIKRNGEYLKVPLQPVFIEASDCYRVGLYIRNTAAGVGTLSFYDKDSGIYGALGHVIMDLDSNKPLEIIDGQIVKANIVNITAAQKGQPGEKTGIFIEHEDIMGSIEKNCSFGIFGKINHIDEQNSPYPEPLPLATTSQVEEGPAEILTVIEGEAIENFEIEIEKVIKQAIPGDKSMIIKVTDERLLEITGGIVQGMSGSPIIQNGKLVGAVTHVFVNDPTRGYGIFIEWMINEAGTGNDKKNILLFLK